MYYLLFQYTIVWIDADTSHAAGYGAKRDTPIDVIGLGYPIPAY